MFWHRWTSAWIYNSMSYKSCIFAQGTFWYCCYSYFFEKIICQIYLFVVFGSLFLYFLQNYWWLCHRIFLAKEICPFHSLCIDLVWKNLHWWRFWAENIFFLWWLLWSLIHCYCVLVIRGAFLLVSFGFNRQFWRITGPPLKNGCLVFPYFLLMMKCSMNFFQFTLTEITYITPHLTRMMRFLLAFLQEFLWFNFGRDMQCRGRGAFGCAS